MSEYQYDVIVIGGGPGGYVAAIRSSQLKMKTAIVEKDKLGGICLNWGCIPTKALLKNAEVIHQIKNASEFGIKIEGFSFDFSKIIQRSRDVSSRIVKGVEFLMKKNKIDKYDGFAKLLDKNTVGIFDKQGNQKEKITAKNIIIATGARAREIPGIKNDGEKIISSTEAMVLPKQPKDMVIIGAGAIGVEFAYFYNTLGTKVILIEMMPNILPIEDAEISKLLEKEFNKSGINVMTSSKVQSISKDGSGVVVKVEKDGKLTEVKGEIALVAIGVQGNIEGIGLEQLGIKTEKGFIVVDKKTYQTNIPNIFAIGDVNGPPWLAHVASAEGIACVEKIAGVHSKDVDYSNVPGCTYCQPQVASIGLTEAQAKEKAEKEGSSIKVGRYQFRSHGKNQAIGETRGMVKLIFDSKYGELLGAHIIGHEATELIAELGLAKSLEATAESIFKTMHAHPTLSEAIMEAAADAYGEAIHV
ncbi:MAG: dihydrolipoyl dehydrogenase [Ignavibacteria bacterium]|nr:dihydrolipoyl dehydrogenase [Ignavibacteria bacterium]